MDNNVIELKNTINEFITNINTRIDDICNNYKITGTTAEERLRNLLDDLQSLYEGVVAISEYYDCIDILEFKDKLDMMESSLVDFNVPLFYDVMQFELRSLLTFWKKCLSE